MHLLLLLERGSGKHRGGQRLLALDEHCLLRRRSSSWSHHLSRHHLGWRVASSWRVLEALLRTHLGSNHRHWWHAWPGHHGHWLRSGLVHRPWLLLPNSGSSHAGSAGSNATSHAHSSHAHAGHTAGPWHCLLLWPAGLGTDLGRSEEALGLGHRGHEVTSHAHLLHAAHLLHPHASHPLDVLGSQVSLPVLLSLCEGNIEGLGNDDPAVHLSDGLGRLLGRGEANKTEAFATALFVHHLGAGDCPIGSKLLPQPLVVDGVIKVFDVEVDALVPVQPLQLQLLKLLLQLLLTLGLLLGSPDVQGLAEHLDSVELVHGFLSRLAVFKGDESEAFVLSVRSGLHDVLTFLALDIPILHHFVGGDLAKLGEHFLEFLVSKVLSEVLDVHVGELLGLLSQLLLVEQHAVDLLDGVHGGLLRLKMNEAIAFGATVGVLGNLAAEDVPEGREGVVHRLVVDALVQVLDEDVADTAPPEGRVTLAPHDTDGTSLEHVKVHRVEGTFGISGLLKVDVGVPKRAPGDHVPTHSDGEDWPCRRELLKEHRLSNLRGEIADVE